MSVRPLGAEAITGLILAGGRGQRLGGADKGLLLVDGQPLVAHVASALRPQLSTLLISANRNLERYALLGTVVVDAEPGFSGPLHGLLAGLQATRTEWLCCCPCDLLGLPADAVQQLASALSAVATARAAYAVIGGDALYPLCVVHSDLGEGLAAWLAQRPDAAQRAFRSWLQSVDAVAVPLAGWQGGAHNINSFEVLQAVQPPQSG